MTETSIFSAKAITDANILLKWIRSYICQPHPQLGREGDVCPFVQPALHNNMLHMALHYEVYGQSLAELEAVMRSYLSIFQACCPAERSNALLQTLLVVFPAIPAERSTIIDHAHQDLKSEFVQQGLMLGQFHMTCSESAVHNPAFQVMVSPLPFFAIRYMAQHDILFLHQRSDWFKHYSARMGNAYAQGKVSNATFVRLYEAAKQRSL
jgi:hypothetical protein